MDEAEKRCIGFDLDGVIADITSQLRRFIRRSLGIRLSAEALTSEDIETCTPVSREYLISFFCDPSFFRTLRPLPGARRSLSAVRNAGASIHIITDRFWYAGLHEDTEQWLHKYGLPFDSLHFARKDRKPEIAAKLRLLGFVEDQLSNANLISHCCPVLLLDRPYNRGTVEANVCRVNSLQDAVERIVELPGCEGFRQAPIEG